MNDLGISNGNAALDFGPQTRRGVRDFGTGGLGTPEGDRNKFYLLRNKEFDYDQPTVATIDPLDTIWLPPPADRVATWVLLLTGFVAIPVLAPVPTAKTTTPRASHLSIVACFNG